MTSPRYTLFHSHYSLPSIIACFLVAMRGSSNDGIEYVFTEHAIDVFAGEQISTLFREGGDVADIPALRNESNRQVVSGPVGIAQHLGARYPALFPRREASAIRSYITQLQELDWFSLSLPVPVTSAGGVDRSSVGLQSFQQDLERRLDSNASAWYRAALMYRIRTLQTNTDETARIFQVREQARSLLESITRSIPNRSSRSWAFGTSEPTALDAHLVSSLARLQDAGNEDLIPPRLVGYLEAARRTRYWREVMGERRTLR